MMVTRRNLLIGVASLRLPARAQMSRFLRTTASTSSPGLKLDLADDLETARKGKRFVVMWELKGCPYCKETHFVNFAQSRISEYIKANFEVLQLNIIGSRKVTDFDGQELSEKDLAAKYGVRFTPTFQFFGESAATLKGLPPTKREVSRAPGYMRPDDFLAMFRCGKAR
jgi:thioredoxin-related protein